MDEFLFDMTKVPYRPAKRETEKGEPEPFLEPAWRDDSGQIRFVVFELIYRSFAYTLIHEHIFTYVGQHNTHLPAGADIPSFRFEGRLEEFLKDGFPKPEPGGAMTPWDVQGTRQRYRVLIFCDDLFLCPQCGEFHEPKETVIMFPWIRDDLSIDHDAIQKVIQARRSAPEFLIQECGRNDCPEIRRRVVAGIKWREETDALMESFKAELAKPKAPTPPPPLDEPEPEPPQPKKVSVYAIKAGEFIKIGLATNVKHRLLGLQTSSPLLLSILNAWEHDEAPRMERRLHEKFKQFRVNGEWFRLDETVVEELRRATRIEDLL